jgi:hypothetical protein
MTLTVLYDGFLQVAGDRRTDLKAGGVDEGDQQRFAAVARQFDRPPLAVEQDEVADRLPMTPCERAKAAFSSRVVSARPPSPPCGRAVSFGFYG